MQWLMRLLGGGSEGAPLSEVDQTIQRGWLWLLIGFGGFLLWATLAPLDEGVPVTGTVTVETKRKTIQHATGGIIKQVLVKEGQLVKAGEVLVVMDDDSSRAEYETARQRYFGLRAMESRLVAEQTGAAEIDFHPDVIAAEDDVQVKQHIDTQTQLLHSRESSLKSELAAVDESMRGQEAAIRGFKEQLSAKQSQRLSLEGELDGMRDLVAEGYAPKNKQWELERMHAQVSGDIQELRANIDKASRGIGELRMRRAQREHDERKEIDSQLADVRREVEADGEKLKSTGNDLDRTTIRAPVAGYVVGIATQTVGGVIPPGGRLMDVIPENEGLVLEAQVPPHLRDKLRVGLLADIHLSTFHDDPNMVIEGTLTSVAADLLTDQVTNNSYYLVRVTVTAEGEKHLGKHHIQPGMPADVVIKTGERTLLRYLLEPLLKRLNFAMKEA